MLSLHSLFNKLIKYYNPSIDDIKNKIINHEVLSNYDWRILNEYIESNGWAYHHLFMRGTKWTKDNNELLIINIGIMFNNNKINFIDIFLYI